jgi:hypothetical protein
MNTGKERTVNIMTDFIKKVMNLPVEFATGVIFLVA